MKKDCTKPCFSYGCECGVWMDMNCDNCVKGSRYNAKNDTYTKIRCTIQEDILTQYLGKGKDAKVYNEAVFKEILYNRESLVKFLQGTGWRYYDHQRDKKGKLVSVKIEFNE